LLASLLVRTIFDARKSPADLAWFNSKTFVAVCEALDLSAGRVRAFVRDQPASLRALRRALG